MNYSINGQKQSWFDKQEINNTQEYLKGNNNNGEINVQRR